MKNKEYIIFENIKDCSNMSFEQSFNLLKEKIGTQKFKKALNININYSSCVSNYKDTSWTQCIKIIGINPRITKTYWGIIKYAMTFPEQGIHIMPLFETGDGSLYVQNSWRLNNDFLDEDLLKLGYKTSEEQLKLTLNILHAMGKIVGFDALPHVDNFSKIVLINPKYFEWVKLNQNKTMQLFPPEIDYNTLYLDVQNIIIETLNLPEDLYNRNDREKEELIFQKGTNEFQIRMKLRKAIRNKGYEPIPVVEHIPLRPIIFNKIETDGNENWASFSVEGKNNSAKIFGAITPYKLYETDFNGYPIKDGKLKESWEYFSNKIYEFQSKYNFDFLRADMAHNQTSHSHSNPDKDCNCDELWKYVKSKIQKNKPYFATMAEAFYSTYYIDGISDMINKNFDIVLGSMNFKNLDSEYLNFIDDFLKPFRDNFSFHPCITVFTNDCDLPENNIFYSSNKENIIRCFISLFLNLPSYMGMGFELRDINPVNNQNYSNDYIKNQKENYKWGNNTDFYGQLTKLRQFYIQMKKIIENYNFNLLYSLNNELSLCFEYIKNEFGYLFVVNLNENENIIQIENHSKNINLIFSNSDLILDSNNDENIIINNIKIWEYAVCEYKK